MASSSRPFQSQTVSRLLAGYRQMAHGAEHLLRRGKTALLWGVQVITFPLYVAFQGVRSAARTLETTQPWQQVVALFTGKPPQPLSLAADSPIRALLSMTQPLAVPQSSHLRQEKHHGELLRQSRAEGVMVSGQWQMVPLQTPVCGVASDLATRHLVLVTTNNVIFNGLTDLQRQQLQRAITLLMAEYASWGRRQWHNRQLQSSGLPLPQATDRQWLPVRWFNQALAWMQVSPLAQVTNLFGEAEAVPQLGQGGMVGWWERAMAGEWRSALQEPPQPGAALEAGAALAMYPDTSLPVPYGVSVWAWSADGLGPQAEGSSLVKAGVSSVAAQAQATREVIPYLNPDGTVARADGAGTMTLNQTLAGEDGPAHGVTAGWNRAMIGWGDRKGLPGNDAIEAQVALVTYVDHPLVMVLRWLDALLHGVETWIQRAWRWLWEQS